MAKESRVGRTRAGIAVIGAGNWGSSLAAAVVSAGIPLVEVVVRRADDGRREIGGVRTVPLASAALDAEVLWICVPDGEIASVAGQIVRRRPKMKGQVVLHSSGALTVETLAVARLAGAKTGGVAPIFSFPTREPVVFAGTLFAVELAADAGPGLWRRLAALVRRLGGRPLRIASAQKVLYHAAATMASPLLVSALHAAVATARKAGLGQEEAEGVVGALATATVRNYFEKGSARSFSGAFARGDAGTVELHLRALVAHPMLHGLYRQLARHAVDALPVKNGLELGRVLDLAGRKRRVRD
jgi:predicted short-subunit dehydrogenase-like oxidoreductase (DUF2520 family)